MKSVAAVLTAAWIAADCATATAQYNKARVTDGERRHDRMNMPRTSITGGGVRRGFALFRIDRAAYQKCMTDRGYTIRTAS